MDSQWTTRRDVSVYGPCNSVNYLGHSEMIADDDDDDLVLI